MILSRGDIVARISYGKDIFFKVASIDIDSKTAKLKGIDVRLYADAPLADLVRPGIGELANYRARSMKLRVDLVAKASRTHQQLYRNKKESTKKPAADYVDIPGTVLHLDGDQEYMEVCRKAYADLEIINNCFQIPEDKQSERVESLLREYNPDILVLTGHDGMLKFAGRQDGVNNYHNSRHFIAAVAKARKYQPSKDELVIFAGACQSWYQGIVAAGANFASSPERVLIHCLDPVLVVEKIAYTPVGRTISIYETLSHCVTGLKGVGGIESRGHFRLGLPKIIK